MAQAGRGPRVISHPSQSGSFSFHFDLLVLQPKAESTLYKLGTPQWPLAVRMMSPAALGQWETAGTAVTSKRPASCREG